MTKVELQTVLKLIDLRIGVTEDSKKLKRDLKDLFQKEKEDSSQTKMGF